MAQFTIDTKNLTDLRNKGKLFSSFNSILTRTFFKVSNNEFKILFRGVLGVSSYTMNISCDCDTPLYFTVDYNKWFNAIQKFNNVNEIIITIKKTMMQISSVGTSDVINLGIVPFTENSAESSIINDYLDERKTATINDSYQLILTDELLDNFKMMDSLFSAQGKVNSIGFTKNYVTYADRSVVVKTNLIDPLEDSLFATSEEGMIFVHSTFLKLFPTLAKINNSVYYSNEYDTIYWEGENVRLILTSEPWDLALPTEEQWEMIKPQDEASSFSVDLATLSSSLKFFTGFYEETAWKPLTFEITKGKEVTLYYRHPTTEISKTLGDIVGTVDGSFIIGSEILGKILSSIENRFSDEEQVVIMYDEDAPGIYCRVNDTYEFVLSKMMDIV